MSCYTRVARMVQKASFSPDHGQTVVLTTSRREPVTTTSLSFFDYAVEVKQVPP